MSTSLPELVVAAYANLSRHHAAQALLGSYIVIEVLLDHVWQAHIGSATEDGRKKRLKDDRTYSAAIRAEVLLSSGTLPSDLYEVIEPARKLRNKAAHGDPVTIEDAHTSGTAMQAMLEHHLGETVAPPSVSRLRPNIGQATQ